MSTQQHSAPGVGGNGGLPEADSFIRMWTDLASKMTLAGLSFSPDAEPPQVTREVRGAMFGAMSEYWQRFLRSPQFMELLKQSMEASINFRKQLNDFFSDVHQQTQTPATRDVDYLVQMISRLETRVLQRTQDLTIQMERLEQRLQAMEERAPAARVSRSRPAAAKSAGPAVETAATADEPQSSPKPRNPRNPRGRRRARASEGRKAS